MGEIIELIDRDDGKGYITSDNCKKITGVYVNNVAAMIDNGNVYLGTKADDGIDDALLTNLEDMDSFCIMWLGINNPNALKEPEVLED